MFPIFATRWRVARNTALGLAIAAFLLFTCAAIPRAHITIGAGPIGGTYHATALAYQKFMESKGYHVSILSFDNTEEIAKNVNDPASTIDVGFVAQDLRESNFTNILSLGDIQLQPVFVFAQEQQRKIHSFCDLNGLKIVLPPAQSVTSKAVLKIFSLCNIDAKNTTVTFLPLGEAVERLKHGEFDAGIFILSPENEFVVKLATSANLHLVEVGQIDAIAKHFSFMQNTSLPAGVYDLERNIPPAPVALLAAKVSIVVKKNLAPATVYALLEAMLATHRHETLVSSPNEFPSYLGSNLRIHSLVPQFYRSGAPWIYANLGVDLASVADQYLVPVLAVWFLVGLWKVLIDLDGLRKFSLDAMFLLVLRLVQRSSRKGQPLSERERWIVEKIESWVIHDVESANVCNQITKLRIALGQVDPVRRVSPLDP